MPWSTCQRGIDTCSRRYRKGEASRLHRAEEECAIRTKTTGTARARAERERALKRTVESGLYRAILRMRTTRNTSSMSPATCRSSVYTTREPDFLHGARLITSGGTWTGLFALAASEPQPLMELPLAWESQLTLL